MTTPTMLPPVSLSLTEYLALEAEMLVYDTRGETIMADIIRDQMDPAWRRLTDAEHTWLDQRPTIPVSDGLEGNLAATADSDASPALERIRAAIRAGIQEGFNAALPPKPTQRPLPNVCPECHGAGGNCRTQQPTGKREQNSSRHRNADNVIKKRPK